MNGVFVPSIVVPEALTGRVLDDTEPESGHKRRCVCGEYHLARLLLQESPLLAAAVISSGMVWCTITHSTFYLSLCLDECVLWDCERRVCLRACHRYLRGYSYRSTPKGTRVGWRSTGTLWWRTLL